MSGPAPIAAATGPAAPPANDRAALSKAAKQFEAIFVRQMLSAARKTSFDSGGLFSSEAMGTFRQMQDERFADIASERGSFGLAKMIEAHLAAVVAPPKEPG
jgi:flagellar protein FlgJ